MGTLNDWEYWAQDDMRVEERALDTAARKPHLAIEPSERYEGVEHRWVRSAYQFRAANRERVMAKPHVTCDRCEGHGAYNLRRSVMPGDYFCVDCPKCSNLGVVPA
jgi:DnaJ-class molecular chaperone